MAPVVVAGKVYVLITKLLIVAAFVYSEELLLATRYVSRSSLCILYECTRSWHSNQFDSVLVEGKDGESARDLGS